MAWQIIGYIEGRNGHVTLLPSVGAPNVFERPDQAIRGAHGMQVALGGEKSPVRYLAVPILDKRMHDVIVQADQPQQPPPQQQSSVSFTAPGPTPQPAQAFPGNGALQP